MARLLLNNKNMKKELTLIIKNHQKAFALLEELKIEGYNATIVSSESLHHALDYDPHDHHFLNLRQIDRHNNMQSMYCVFIVDEAQINIIKKVINDFTNHFKDVKGAMYVRDILDYEGSL